MQNEMCAQTQIEFTIDVLTTNLHFDLNPSSSAQQWREHHDRNSIHEPIECEHGAQADKPTAKACVA